MSDVHAYILFTDLKGFSKLSELENIAFFRNVLPLLSKEVIGFRDKTDVWNTWGDALIAVSRSPEVIVNLAIAYRKFFQEFEFEASQLPTLSPRIACHFGHFQIFEDPLLEGRKNAIGTNINTTARIEPITRPNEIYVTSDFKESFEKSPLTSTMQIEFDELGEIPLAKDFGSFHLFRLRRSSEPQLIVDRILKQDLSQMLPEAEVMSDDDYRNIMFLKSSPSPEVLLTAVESITNKSEHQNENFLFQVAKLLLNFGCYQECKDLIEKIKTQTTDVDGVEVSLFKYRKDLLKLETNCLTRLGEYEEASNLIYGVWQIDGKDSDTLSMLAAQYKRRALIDSATGNTLSNDDLNSDLLNRAKSLYIEAFRLNATDFYPAINAAYLYKISGGLEMGRGGKLASYVLNNLIDAKDDWWSAIAEIECEIIQGDFEDLGNKLKKVVERFSPTFFERNSTKVQLEIYSNYIDEKEAKQVHKLIKLLD